MTWPCFWVEETGEVELSLRRFTFGQYEPSTPGDGYHDDRPDHVACPSMPKRDVKGQPGKTYQSGHDASVPIGRGVQRRNAEGYLEVVPRDEYPDDPRWPMTCEHCGGPMPDAALYQVNQEPIMREVDVAEGVTPREWSQKQLPAGAMFDARWDTRKGPDGVALVVVLPSPSEDEGKRDARPHFWHVDGTASSGGHWKRTGDPKTNPPTVTATPSILSSDYHGYLRDGVLTDPV